MTLQSSGAIAISQMRDEYALGNPIAMSHFYGKNGLPSSGTIRFSDFYGKSNILDTQTVTVGTSSDGYLRGYAADYQTGTRGSIADGSSNIYGGSFISRLSHYHVSNIHQLQFILGSLQPNSGWTKMVIDGVEYLRTSAAYSQNGNYSLWIWNIGTAVNPFGTTNGVTKTVTWY